MSPTKANNLSRLALILGSHKRASKQVITSFLDSCHQQKIKSAANSFRRKKNCTSFFWQSWRLFDFFLQPTDNFFSLSMIRIRFRFRLRRKSWKFFPLSGFSLREIRAPKKQGQCNKLTLLCNFDLLVSYWIGPLSGSCCLGFMAWLDVKHPKVHWYQNYLARVYGQF